MSQNTKFAQKIIKVKKRSSFSDAVITNMTSGYSSKESIISRHENKLQENFLDLWHMTMNAICNDMSKHPDIVKPAKKLAGARRYFQNVCLTEQHLIQTTKNLDDAMDIAVVSAILPDRLSSNSSPYRAVDDFDGSFKDTVEALRML